MALDRRFDAVRDGFRAESNEGLVVVRAVGDAHAGEKEAQYWATSVIVATVDLRVPRVTRCSMETAGGMPSRKSMSGRGSCSTYWRAHDDIDSMKRRWLSAKDNIEGKRALPRAAYTGHDGERAVRNLQGDVFEIVFARARKW